MVDSEPNVIKSNNTSNDEIKNLPLSSEQNESLSVEKLIPPGKPDIEKINGDKYLAFNKYEPNGEWKRQWRKSIR